MDSKRLFVKKLLMTLPPLKTERLLQILKIPRVHYRVLHGLYVEHEKQQTVADKYYMSLETLKRRNAEGLDFIVKSLDEIDPQLF